MRLHSAIMAGALVLAPVLAFAAQPVFVQVDGRTVAAQETSRIVQTADGPAHVKTWSWHSPNGEASFVMQSSTGGMPPADLRRMQARMQMQMVQMAAMQAQMQALQQAALGGMPAFAAGAPLDAMFAGPPVVLMQMPQPVLYLVPVAPPARTVAPARTPAPMPAAPAPATRKPGLEV
ncbi:hypothetical protein [Burkholderia gladioli]|uniref:hypothetical protein n=1 Tax=Burkholderia gladioli TaxID=28095 RepID=UPI000D00EA9E|nr:hypothetical protein [Burkholderia gladioli]MBU9216374.1 hypothetical protein [Burkholderia gladioli]MBU9275016.1 hypothetical protein [Burkholderia gladioli]MBU9321599.1 hypothetical protein [Burkholderia gladioli]MBU9379848.1 hypothetical protein [Burkholderia gladioli]MDN7727713.1 hypothetical protein [Burkholderia gladioli]